MNNEYILTKSSEGNYKIEPKDINLPRKLIKWDHEALIKLVSTMKIGETKILKV